MCCIEDIYKVTKVTTQGIKVQSRVDLTQEFAEIQGSTWKYVSVLTVRAERTSVEFT